MKLYSKKQQLGQGMVEYVIIVAIVAVAGIALFMLFGSTVRNQTAAIAMEVAGQNGTGAISAAGNSAKKAENVAKDSSKGSLSTYGDQAAAGRQ